MTPCQVCRWYVIALCGLASRTRRATTFAHAHHHLTRGASDALHARRLTRAAYGRHKATCGLRTAKAAAA